LTSEFFFVISLLLAFRALQCCAQDMSLGELIYFPVQAKGLQLAILAEASGLEWTGFTVDKSPAGPKSWPAIKASGASPFGQLPMLRTPGGRVVGQSVAIANYIAHRASMHGAGDDDFALSQMCLAEGEDLYSLLLGAELARWKPREVRAAKAEAVRGLIATTVPDRPRSPEIAGDSPRRLLATLAPRRGCGQRSEPAAFTPASAQVPDHLAKLEALCAAPLGFTSTGQTAGELYLSGMLEVHNQRRTHTHDSHGRQGADDGFLRSRRPRQPSSPISPHISGPSGP